jgi:hypothetical protein
VVTIRGRRGRGTSRRAPDQPCLNCGDPTHGDYCRSCGQAKRIVAVSVGALIGDVLEDQLVLNRALPRTLLYLLVRPGFLTVEYINGRIVRYIAPFRLYLVGSVVFFLLLSFVGLRALDEVRFGGEERTSSEAVRTGLGESERALAAIDTTALPAEARLRVAEALRQIQQIPGRVETEAAEGAQADVPVRSDNREAAAPLPPELARLQPWARSIRRDTADLDGLGKRMALRLADRYGHLAPQEAFRDFASAYLEYVPHMMFLLLPIFALILKLLYIRRRRYYAEHFVFALHVHAFMFVMFILMFAISKASVNVWILLWPMIYLWLAMRRVYAQGFFRTTAKYFILGFAYATLLTVALTVTGFVALMLG